MRACTCSTVLGRKADPRIGIELVVYSSILKSFSWDPTTFRTPHGSWKPSILKGRWTGRGKMCHVTFSIPFWEPKHPIIS